MARLYIIIFIVAILAGLGYGAYYIYNDIMSRMATLRDNNAKMEVAIQSKDAVINDIQNNLNKQIELTKTLQGGLAKIEQDNNVIKEQIDNINILENSINNTNETEKNINEQVDLIFDGISTATQ